MQFTTFNEEVAEQLKRAAETTGGLAGYLGFRHTEFTAGRLIAEMDARDDLKTPFGNLHGGGCLSAMVDHCLGVVFFYPVIPMGSWVATTEFKLNLLRPVSSGTCVATAEIIALAEPAGWRGSTSATTAERCVRPREPSPSSHRRRVPDVGKENR